MSDVMKTDRGVMTTSELSPVLRLQGISKAFGHVQALDNVELEIHRSEVLALVGDNGAGKSTLVKILSGVYTKDSGEIYSNGELVNIHSPKDARNLAGISTVFQDLALVDVRDVGSNIYLNIEPVRMKIFINYSRMYEDAREIVDRLRIDLPSVKVKVSELSGGQRQAVAICRALARHGDVMLLDEPAAALGVEQQKKVNDLIIELSVQGNAILLISHNLSHVFEVADRIAVMRQGKLVAVRRKQQTNPEEIVGLITGAING